MAEAQITRIRCLADGQGAHFLVGNTDSGVVSLGSGNDPGAEWLLKPSGGANEFTVACMAGIDPHDILFGPDEPRFLDGNTFTGEVKLVLTTAPPFSGTRWQVSQGDDATTFHCLGVGGPADAATMLDGWIQQGTVQLRQPLPQFTGIKWALDVDVN
jgi:hypothetical protein